MKKLLLVSTAIAGVAMMSAPASAALKMDLGGYFRGYGVYADNNEPASTSLRRFEFRRNNEIHVNGETTLDNGLTIGAHTELEIANESATAAPTANGNMVDETYMYTSGGWGRVNFGSEDGAAYLLQVGAPSADSNVDGMRVYIQALNPTVSQATIPGLRNSGVLSYDHADFRQTDRLTYLTPKFSGFQAGVSYAPKPAMLGLGNGTAGMSTDKDVGQTGQVWEGSARWDGEFQGFGVSLGGGYSDSTLENYTRPALVATAPVASDGLRTWNGGANVSFSGFSLGGSYLKSNTQNIITDSVGPVVNATPDVTQTTWVLGGGWDNGPYHLGASYLHQQTERDASASTLVKADYKAQRYTVGGGYTFGPGMTFRGAVAWGNFKNNLQNNAGGGFDVAANDQDFTQVTVGTDIQF